MAVACFAKHASLQFTARAHEKNGGVRHALLEGPRDGDTREQMPAGTAPGDHDMWCGGGHRVFLFNQGEMPIFIKTPTAAMFNTSEVPP